MLFSPNTTTIRHYLTFCRLSSSCCLPCFQLSLVSMPPLVDHSHRLPGNYHQLRQVWSCCFVPLRLPPYLLHLAVSWESLHLPLWSLRQLLMLLLLPLFSILLAQQPSLLLHLPYSQLPLTIAFTRQEQLLHPTFALKRLLPLPRASQLWQPFWLPVLHDVFCQVPLAPTASSKSPLGLHPPLTSSFHLLLSSWQELPLLASSWLRHRPRSSSYYSL